jgi:hypothetical protein
MNIYSIVRIGSEYVVRADDKSVLKVANLRKAARLVTRAAELLDSQPNPKAPAQTHTGSSIARDPSKVP